MGFTFIAATYAEHWSTDKSVIDCVATLNVAEGDLLVAVISFTTTARTITSVAETGGGNAFQVSGITNQSAVYGAMAHRIAATASPTATFRLTLSGNTTQPSLLVMQWRPDAGDTVELASISQVGGNGALAQTPNFSLPVSDDLLVVGGLSSHNQTAPTGKQIADLAADGSAWAAGGYDTHGWWKTFTSAQTGIHAQISIGYSDWVCLSLGFKSTGVTNHALTPSGVTTASSVASPAMNQAHALTPSGITAAAQIPTVELSQANALIPEGLTVASSVDDAVVEQIDTFTLAGLLVATETGNPTLMQVHALTLQGLLVTTGQHDLAMSESAYMLEPIGLLAATSIQAAALIQDHLLTLTGLLVLPAVGDLVFLSSETIYEIINLTARLLRTVDLEATITKEINLTSELI